MSRVLCVLGVASLFAVQPSFAHAQIDGVVQAVRELTTAASQPEPARSNGIRASADKIVAAVAEWDRRIATLEERVKTASGADAYQRHIELGVAYRARGRTFDALRELDAAAALRPSSSDLQVLRALMLDRLGQFDEAGRAFRTAWTLDVGDPVKAYYVVVPWSRATTEERDRARTQLLDAYRRLRTVTARPSMPPFAMIDPIPDTLTSSPIVGDNRTASAFGLLSAGQFDDAVNALRREQNAPTGGSDSPAAHFARARDVETHNRIAEAKAEYKAALPGVLTGHSAILVEMARLSQIEGNPAEALEWFRAALRLNPNDPMIHRELADAYVADGRMDDAFSELVAALLIDPLDAQAFAAIGQLSLNGGHFSDAVDAFSRALELKPGAFEIRYALATALTRAGNTAEAARQFEQYERLRREALEKRRQDIR